MSIPLDPGSPTEHGQSKAGYHGRQYRKSGVRVRTLLASFLSGASNEAQVLPRGVDMKRHTMYLNKSKMINESIINRKMKTL